MLPKDELPGELLAARLEEYALALAPIAHEQERLQAIPETLADLAGFSRGLEEMNQRVVDELNRLHPDADEPDDEDDVMSPDWYFGVLYGLDIVLNKLAGGFDVRRVTTPDDNEG